MFSYRTALLSSAFLLAACGGGGGSTPTPTPPAPTPPPAPTNTAPSAVASASATAAQEGRTVTLDGSGSTDADNDALTYSWTQTAGTPGMILDASAPVTDVVLGEVDADETATFELRVSDGTDSDTARLDVGVENIVATPLVTGNFTTIGTLSTPLRPVDLQSGLQRNFGGDRVTSTLVLSQDPATLATRLSEYYLDGTDTPRLVQTGTDLPDLPSDAVLGDNLGRIFQIATSETQNQALFFLSDTSGNSFRRTLGTVDIDQPCSSRVLTGSDPSSDRLLVSYLIGTRSGLFRANVDFGTVATLGTVDPVVTLSTVIPDGEYCSSLFAKVEGTLDFDRVSRQAIVNTAGKSVDTLRFTWTLFPGTGPFTIERTDTLALDIPDSDGLDIVATTLGFDPLLREDLAFGSSIPQNETDAAGMFALLTDGLDEGTSRLVNLRFDLADGALANPRVVESREWTGGTATGLGQSAGFDPALMALVVTDPTFPFLRVFEYTEGSCFGPGSDTTCPLGRRLDGDASFFPIRLGVGDIFTIEDINFQSGIVLAFPGLSEIRHYLTDIR